MRLILHASGQTIHIAMEQAGEQTVMVGEYQYKVSRLAQKVRRLANRMWESKLSGEVLEQRFYFEAAEGARGASQWADSGSFSPVDGAMVGLGRWDEDGTVGIALHELAHEMHLRGGGYNDSDGVIREALALLAEREAGLSRSFDREPYYTAANLVAQLTELPAFRNMAFSRRWEEVASLNNDVGLADLVNYYLDKSERLGLAGWLKRYSDNVELRDALLNKLATTSLRYSLAYRRTLIRNLVRCERSMPLEQLFALFDVVITLDKRYPEDDLSSIIDFCFAPVVRPKRRLLAFGM
jgi:hypothetical protein